MEAWPLFALVAAIAVLLVVTARANEVFRIAVRDGRAELVRGKAPPGFLDDVRALASACPPGTVRAVKRGGRAVLVLEGLDERTAQRLRNTFSTYATALTRGRARARL